MWYALSHFDYVFYWYTRTFIGGLLLLIVSLCVGEGREITKTLSVQGGNWGTWGEVVYCPEGSFADGYKMKVLVHIFRLQRVCIGTHSMASHIWNRAYRVKSSLFITDRVEQLRRLFYTENLLRIFLKKVDSIVSY